MLSGDKAPRAEQVADMPGSAFPRFAAAVLAAASLNFANPADARHLEVGDVAPDATFNLVDGTRVRLSDLRGQVVLINFWATWCGPCRTELPTLDSYYRIQKKFGLRMFAATTEGSVPIFRLHKLFDTMEISPIRTMSGPYAPIDNQIPTNYIIGRDGRIRYAKPGALTLDDLNRELIPALEQPMQAAGGSN